MHNPFSAFTVTQGFHDKHRAIDYAMPIGTPLPAPSTGRVVYEWFQDAGYTATIHRPDGSWTRYTHGSPHGFPRPHTVREGELVRMLSGNSGRSTGPHLHAFDVDAQGIRRPPFTTGPRPIRKRRPVFSIVPQTDGRIMLQSLVTGRETHIRQEHHVGLLQRFRDNDDSDKMLPAEVALCRGYVAAIAPVEGKPVKGPSAEEIIDELAERLAS